VEEEEDIIFHTIKAIAAHKKSAPTTAPTIIPIRAPMLRPEGGSVGAVGAVGAVGPVETGGPATGAVGASVGVAVTQGVGGGVGGNVVPTGHP